jgi:hypothetical protein
VVALTNRQHGGLTVFASEDDECAPKAPSAECAGAGVFCCLRGSAAQHTAGSTAPLLRAAGARHLPQLTA